MCVAAKAPDMCPSRFCQCFCLVLPVAGRGCSWSLGKVLFGHGEAQDKVRFIPQECNCLRKNNFGKIACGNRTLAWFPTWATYVSLAFVSCPTLAWVRRTGRILTTSSDNLSGGRNNRPQRTIEKAQNCEKSKTLIPHAKPLFSPKEVVSGKKRANAAACQERAF